MVDEYIRRQEMLDAVEELNIIPSIDGMGKPTPTEDLRVQFLGTVLHVPSADVVPVVRCKDCENWDIEWKPIIAEGHYCVIIDKVMKPNDFCSYGKLK